MESIRPVDLALQLLPTLLLMAINDIRCKQSEQLDQCSLQCVENSLTDCVRFISSIRHPVSLNELPKLQVQHYHA